MQLVLNAIDNSVAPTPTMEHSTILDGHGQVERNGKTLHQRATGRFYTHALIGEHLASEISRRVPPGASPIRAVDPFCGDGRLLVWLLQAAAAQTSLADRDWEISLWDQDGEAVGEARERVAATARACGIDVAIIIHVGDTFTRGLRQEEARAYEIVVTNPPWELVKPDTRETREMPPEVRAEYISALRRFDERLRAGYPDAQPARRFAGWGTNLARVGTDVALRLVAEGGVCGVVSPSSLFADSNSVSLRARLFGDMTLEEIAYFPAEARLFETVDVPCVAFVATRRPAETMTPTLTIFGPSRTVEERGEATLTMKALRRLDYVVPTAFGVAGVRVLEQLATHPTFATLESRAPDGLWAGRELDETRKESFLRESGEHGFLKGAHVVRFGIARRPESYVDADAKAIPTSASHPRLVWRDVSRPNQKRRVHATLIPPGWVTGNSLGVAYFRDDDLLRLSALLGLMSSIPFEYQLRSTLSTGHVSLSAVRRVHVPDLQQLDTADLSRLAVELMDGDRTVEAELEVAAARAYDLDRSTWRDMLDAFPKLTATERSQLEDAWR